MHRQQASTHGRQALPLTHQLLALPDHGPFAFLLLAGHAHDAERLLVAPHVAIQSLAQGQRIEPVIFDSLASIIPILGLHDEVGHSHRCKPSMQMISERPRLVTGVDLPGQFLLPGDKEEQLLKGHLLDRLWRGAIDLTAHVVPLGMRVDAKFDRFVLLA
jgi:hypothetical protein